MYAPVAIGIEQNLVNKDVFRNFAESRVRSYAPDVKEGVPCAEYDHTYCSECKVPLVTGAGTAECPGCHRIFEDAATLTTHDNASSSSIRKATKNGRHKYYSVTSDYSRTQRKQILDQLVQNNNMYTGAKFSRDILQKVATLYNSIQRQSVGQSTDATTADGASAGAGASGGGKKFVRRGSIKDEILSALIYYECIRAGVTRKKKDIAAMMRLPVNGFSNGDSIVRALHSEGVISLPVDTEPFMDFVLRYMEALGIDNMPDSARMRAFVIDIVSTSEREKIGMNSQLSSKVVGAMWAVIVACKLQYTSTMLERAADNIKKSTFMKFYKIICAEREVFGPIYAAHGMELA